MRIRDSLSGELRELLPGADGVIGMYVCGPTVYNRIHVGNARPFVVFQLMKRSLEWRGQPVLPVQSQAIPLPNQREADNGKPAERQGRKATRLPPPIRAMPVEPPNFTRIGGGNAESLARPYCAL